MICQYSGCQTLFFPESPFSVISLTCVRAEPLCNGQDNVESQVLCIPEHTQKNLSFILHTTHDCRRNGLLTQHSF